MIEKVSKVSSKGLTTIPIRIRRELDIKEGSQLKWKIIEGKIIVTKIQDPEEILKGRFENLSYDDAEAATDELLETEASS